MEEDQSHLAKRHDHRYVNISSSIIFAINRDRKLANDTGGGEKISRKESRTIVSLIPRPRPRFQTQPLFLFLFISLSSSSKIRIYHDAEYDGNSPNLDH